MAATEKVNMSSPLNIDSKDNWNSVYRKRQRNSPEKLKQILKNDKRKSKTTG